MEGWEPRNKQQRTWRILDAIEEIAMANGVNQGQVSLAWLEARPAVTSVILGVRNTDRRADNLGATSVELTADELKRLDEVGAPVVSDYLRCGWRGPTPPRHRLQRLSIGPHPRRPT